MRLSSATNQSASTITANCDKKKKIVGSKQQISDKKNKTGRLPNAPTRLFSLHSAGSTSENKKLLDEILELSNKFSLITKINGENVPLQVVKGTKGSKEDLQKLSSLSETAKKKGLDLSAFHLDKKIPLYTDFFKIDPQNIINNLNSQFDSQIRAIETGLKEDEIPNGEPIIGAINELSDRGILSESDGRLIIKRLELAYAKRALLTLKEDVEMENSRRLAKNEAALTKEEVNAAEREVEQGIADLSNEINELIKKVNPETLKLLPLTVTEAAQSKQPIISEAESPIIEAVIVPEATPEQPKTITIGRDNVKLTETNEPNKYKLTWPGDEADGGVIVEIKGENDFLITNANGITRDNPFTDKVIKEALLSSLLNLEFIPPAVNPETGSVEETKVVAPIAMTVDKPVELTAYETTAAALIAAYKDIENYPTKESLKELIEAEEATLKPVRLLALEANLLEQIKKVIHLTAMERQLKLAEKTLQDNNSKPAGDKTKVIDNSLEEAVNAAKENVDTAKTWIMNSLETEETLVLNSYLEGMNALDPALDKDAFAKAFEAQEKARKWAEGKLEATRRRNPILNDYLSEELSLLVSDTTVRKNIHEFNNRVNAQMAKLENLKKGEILDSADLGEIAILSRVIQYSIAEKGKNPLQDTFISEKALPFLEKINSQLGLALLEEQITFQQGVNEKLDQAVSLTTHNTLVEEHNDLVDSHNLLQSEVNAYKSLTASLTSSTGTLVNALNETRTELGKTETKVTGLESELGKGVTMPVAGGLAALAGLVGAGLSYFGLKPAIDKAVTDAIKANSDDSKKKKAMV